MGITSAGHRFRLARSYMRIVTNGRGERLIAENPLETGLRGKNGSQNTSPFGIGI